MYRQSEKNLLSSNISSTCPHNMVKFGPLAAEIVSLVWCTPGNFNGFRVLAALLHGTLVVGVSQTAALNRGRHLYSAGRPSRWTLAHILVSFFLLSLTKEPDNNTPAIKNVYVTWSHVRCAFCCSCILAWLPSDFCCSKLCNKSPQQVYMCHLGYTHLLQNAACLCARHLGNLTDAVVV